MLNQKKINLIFQLSALLVLLAAILHAFDPDVAKVAMTGGVIGYAITSIMNRYKGNSLRGKRLFNTQLLSIVFLTTSATLMWLDINGWVVTLLISAVLMLYYIIAVTRVYKQDDSEPGNDANQ